MRIRLMSVSLNRVTHVDLKQFKISSEYLNFHIKNNVKIISSYYANQINLIKGRLKAETYAYMSLTNATIFQKSAEFRSYSVMLSPIKCVRSISFYFPSDC